MAVSGLKVTSPCGCPVSPAQFVKEIVFCLFSHVCFDTFVKNLASGAVWVIMSGSLIQLVSVSLCAVVIQVVTNF